MSCARGRVGDSIECVEELDSSGVRGASEYQVGGRWIDKNDHTRH